jgi:conserved oligomeric Golgi complex subunit 3
VRVWSHSPFLETLCDHLYDSLRPRILHEPRLDILCGLCTVLQALISLDRDHLEDSGPTNGATSELGEANTPSGSDGQLRFGQLLETILQDVQTRLIFRAQAVIQTEVLHYVATGQDLDYPAKLKGVRGLSLWTEADAVERRFRLPDEQTQNAWYPTLRRTMWVLSRLQGYVNVSHSAPCSPKRSPSFS